ncbi:ABC-2 transporter permease [Paenibacillus monticola]|uniref:ABC-2 transporter permease n=1 Tax=Paenibacillus monticola TaxID=2666075 RepID=UPI0012ACF99B
MHHSIYLIRKDFVLVRKFLYLLIIYYISMGFANWSTYSMFAILPPMLLLINSCTLDVHQSNQRFLVSLPVRRQELVLAKYLVLIPFTLFGFASALVVYGIAGIVGHGSDPTFWKEMGITLGAFPLLAAIYLPLYYWLGTKGAQVVNIVFMLTVMLGSSSVAKLFEWSPLLTTWMKSESSNNMLQALIAGIAYIFVMSFSYFISVRIFEKKDVS